LKCVGVFCTGKNRVVKIMHSSFKIVLQMNYKAHNDLFWFRPLLGDNNPTSSSLILKMNRCYKRVSRELEKFTW
jgi:hypothetical protein